MEGTLQIKYVAGFLFSFNRDRIVLIRKERPAWQKGLLNGIGGHIEEGETPLQAMQREYKEEAELEVDPWREFLVLHGKDWQVHFFRAFSTELPKMGELPQLTDEVIDVYQISKLNKFPETKTIPNLRWIIPLALDIKIQNAIAYDKS